MGNREATLSYSDFSSSGLLHAVLISYGIGAALIFLSKRLFLFAGEYTSLAGVLFAFFAVYAAICNQAQIDELMRRRGHRMDQLPARIRRYNLLLIVLCIAVALALLVFYRPLAAGIRTIWDIAASLILWLAHAIQALMEALLHQDELPQEQLPQGEDSSFFPTEEAQGSPLWNILWVLIAVGAVVLLVRTGMRSHPLCGSCLPGSEGHCGGCLRCATQPPVRRRPVMWTQWNPLTGKVPRCACFPPLLHGFGNGVSAPFASCRREQKNCARVRPSGGRTSSGRGRCSGSRYTAGASAARRRLHTGQSFPRRPCTRDGRL